MSCDSSHRKIKHPGETLDYTVDFTDWLTSDDSIAAASWELEAGIDQTDASVTSTTAVIWLSGGDDGGQYTITCTATTTLGRVKQFQFELRVRALAL